MEFTAFFVAVRQKTLQKPMVFDASRLEKRPKKDQKPGKILSERVFEAFGGFKIAQNGIYRVLCTFPAENAGIYTVFCAFPAPNRGAPLDRRLQNTVNTSVFSSSCLQAWGASHLLPDYA